MMKKNIPINVEIPCSRLLCGIFAFTNAIKFVGKGNSVSLVLQGYTSFEKNLRASLRSGSIFSKNLAEQGYGIDCRQQFNHVREGQIIIF